MKGSRFYLFLLLFASLLSAESEVTLNGEIGFLAVGSHKIQFGNNGTYFDYRQDGAQDVLLPFTRLSVDVNPGGLHRFTLLYQPLTIQTEALLGENLIVDNEVFTAGTPVSLLYNFPFYRVSWLREIRFSDRGYLGAGLSLQIRNATISFASLDGEQFRTNRDVGPVPAFKFLGTLTPRERLFFTLEVDGMYAPISYLNGSDSEVVGAIIDASVRGGIAVSPDKSLFLNTRYIAGGAVGTSTDPLPPGDGYVKNWLHFFTVSLGFSQYIRW